MRASNALARALFTELPPAISPLLTCSRHTIANLGLSSGADTPSRPAQHDRSRLCTRPALCLFSAGVSVITQSLPSHNRSLTDVLLSCASLPSGTVASPPIVRRTRAGGRSGHRLACCLRDGFLFLAPRRAPSGSAYKLPYKLT